MVEIKELPTLKDKTVTEIDLIIIERIRELQEAHEGLDHDVALAQATEEVMKKLQSEMHAA